MRINRWLAERTLLSRRAADQAIASGRVFINERSARLGDDVAPNDAVTLDGKPIQANTKRTLIMLNKPVGYVCSRKGQGSKTIYHLLPQKFSNLKPIGRLDKDSSGLLLLTNDGDLANRLTHPSFKKQKIYHVKLDKPLAPDQKTKIEHGVELDDGESKFDLTGNQAKWTVIISEGRNRQIRRTFASLGYKVIELHRIAMGEYHLDDSLKSGDFKII